MLTGLLACGGCCGLVGRQTRAMVAQGFDRKGTGCDDVIDSSTHSVSCVAQSIVYEPSGSSRSAWVPWSTCPRLSMIDRDRPHQGVVVRKHMDDIEKDQDKQRDRLSWLSWLSLCWVYRATGQNVYVPVPIVT